MENRKNILRELESISSTLAGTAPVNPYQVPNGYLEGFATKMLELIKKEGASSLLINATTNPYTVPAGYFENLPGQLLSRVKSERESTLLNDPTNNPYQVPDGYFEGLAESILRRVKFQDALSAKEELEFLSPLLSKLEKKPPFSTPEGYFDQLSESARTGVKESVFASNEPEQLSSLMSRLKAENVYAVPVQYFENLPDTILNLVKRQPARVIAVSFGKKMMRYAAAAVIAGLIATAGILFIQKENASVAPGAMVQTEENLQLQTQKELQGLSDDELLDFIDAQSNPLPDILSIASSSDIESDDVKFILADVPDSELKEYLEEYSDDKEALTN
jgi:hypothetical protein